MIFVTLGTQDKSFDRLLKEIDKLCNEGLIKDKIIVQAGCTKYASKNMEVYDLISQDKFEDYIKKCDVLITHGGVGSIYNGIKHDKKVIAVARLKQYKEHVNDHQLEIIEQFNNKGLIIGLNDVNDLSKALKDIKNFKAKPFKSNNANFIKKLTEYIERA